MGNCTVLIILFVCFLNKLKSLMSVAILTMVPGHGLGEFSLSVPALFFRILFTSWKSSTFKVITFFILFLLTRWLDIWFSAQIFSNVSVISTTLNFSKLWFLKIFLEVRIPILVTVLITFLFTHCCLNELFWAQVNGKHVLSNALYNHNDTFQFLSQNLDLMDTNKVFIWVTVLLQWDSCSLRSPFGEYAGIS